MSRTNGVRCSQARGSGLCLDESAETPWPVPLLWVRRVAGTIPSQGMYPGCGFHSRVGSV